MKTVTCGPNKISYGFFGSHSTRKERWMVPQILRLSPTGPQSRGLRSAADRFWTVLRLLGQILDKLRSSQEELGGWDEDSDMRTK